MKTQLIWAGMIVIVLAAGFMFLQKEMLSPMNEAKAIKREADLYQEENTKESLRKAIEKYAVVIARFPATGEAKEALFMLAQSYEKMGLHEIAWSKYQQLAQENLVPSLNSRIEFKMAKLKILKYRREEGIAALFGLLEKTKDKELRSEIYVELGDLSRHSGEERKAREYYLLALKESPLSRTAMDRIDGKFSGVQAEKEEKVAGSENVLQLLDKGIALFQAGKFSESEKYFSQVVAQSMDSEQGEEAGFYLGNSCFERRDYIGAIRAYNKVIGNHVKTRDAEAYLRKGISYFHREKFANAAKLFSYVQEKYPNSSHAVSAKKWEESAKSRISQKVVSNPEEIIEPIESIYLEGPESGSSEDSKNTLTDSEKELISP